MAITDRDNIPATEINDSVTGRGNKPPKQRDRKRSLSNMKTSIPANLTEKLLCPYCSGELSYRISRREISCSSCGMKLSPEEYETAAAAKARRERSSSSFSSGAISAASLSPSSSQSSSSAANSKASEADNRSSNAPDYAPCAHCRLLLGRGVGDLLGECPVCHEKISGAKKSSGGVSPGEESPAGESSPENSGFAAPDLIVPFANEKEFFIQEFRKYLKALEFVPDSFLESSIESVRAFYIPVFLYDAEISGEVSFHGKVFSEIKTATRGSPNLKQEEFETDAAGSQLYSASPENLTRELSDDIFRNLEPFDGKGARPWSRVYAAIPDLTIPAIAEADHFEHSRRRFKNAFEYFLAEGGFFSCFRATQEQVSVIPRKVSYAWLPVWVMEIKQGGERMLCYMNGQTGKLEADIPFSDAKIRGWLFSGVILLTGVAALLWAPRYMPLSNITESSVMGALCMGILMLIYARISPVRRLFSGKKSPRITGSLMAAAGVAFMVAGCISSERYYWRTILFALAMIAGGSFAVLVLWDGIKKRLARKPRRDPRNEGSMYAAESHLRYRNRRKTGEKLLHRIT